MPSSTLDRLTAISHHDSAQGVLKRLGVLGHPRVRPTPRGSTDPSTPIRDGMVVSFNPTTGESLAGVTLDTRQTYNAAIERAVAAQKQWQRLPAPKRGEIVRRIGNAFRDQLDDLGALVTLEMGKIHAEGKGEVQECVDIADFAVGLSRQLYGLTMPSERASHRLMEQWHPLGTIGVISAFNFPIAVWAWNAMLAAVCGDAVAWKPSLVTPLIAIAGTKIVHDTLAEQDLFTPTDGVKPEDLFPLIIGTDEEVGEAMTADARLPLISATGSCRMGKIVAQKVAARLGRCLLELGGNNAIVLMPDADMDLAARGVVFGAVGTAGQRCTSTRRLLCVGDAAEQVLPRLEKAYASVPIGDPMDPGTLMGPLIARDSANTMRKAIEQAIAEGCTLVAGGPDGIDEFATAAGAFVRPTILRVPKGTVPSITKDETFAPVLYVFELDSFDEAMAVHNDVPQGLSSAIFTDSMRHAERFLSPDGSDCGIVNVNVGTSGAEIGGAFGGEKETGGGRESGSDSWKAYMRRLTCTVNYGDDLPLAQGIKFG
ncbi:MAG: aldehyde dehydrogenase family protein [Phycisphaerales bacterium]